jgi:amphi-Trp domain-containing protein
MKNQKFEYSEQQSLDLCVRQLEALLEGLKSGTVSFSQNQDKLWLRPGAAVDMQLCAEQSGDSERLEIRLGWRRRSLHVVSRAGDDTPPQTVRNWQMPHSATSLDEWDAPSPGPLSVRSLDAASIARYQDIYTASRHPCGDGQHSLDESRFMRALEEAGVEPDTRRELYDLALRAEADGRTSLFEPHVIAAVRKAS